MDWFKSQTEKMYQKDRRSFEKDQLQKLETDYQGSQGYDNLHDWDQNDNASFVKVTLVIITFLVVIVGLFIWIVLV